MSYLKKLLTGMGTLIMMGGLIFILVHSMIVTTIPTENFSRDIFGLPIPQSPTWTSYIPYVGFLLTFLFEFLSLHGLVGVVIVVIIFTIGMMFLKLADRINDEKK